MVKASLLGQDGYRHDTDVYPRENCIASFYVRVRAGVRVGVNQGLEVGLGLGLGLGLVLGLEMASSPHGASSRPSVGERARRPTRALNMEGIAPLA